MTLAIHALTCMGKFSVLLPAVLEFFADASCALWAQFAISMREKDGGRRAKHMREPIKEKEMQREIKMKMEMKRERDMKRERERERER